MYNRLAKLNLPPCFLLREDEKYKKPNRAATTAIDDMVMITVFVVFFSPYPVAHRSSYNITLVCLKLLKSTNLLFFFFFFEKQTHTRERERCSNTNCNSLNR